MEKKLEENQANSDPKLILLQPRRLVRKIASKEKKKKKGLIHSGKITPLFLFFFSFNGCVKIKEK